MGLYHAGDQKDKCGSTQVLHVRSSEVVNRSSEEPR